MHSWRLARQGVPRGSAGSGLENWGTRLAAVQISRTVRFEASLAHVSALVTCGLWCSKYRARCPSRLAWRKLLCGGRRSGAPSAAAVSICSARATWPGFVAEETLEIGGRTAVGVRLQLEAGQALDGPPIGMPFVSFEPSLA